MKLPSESSSSWVHIGFAAFTLASLKAWSEFTELPQADRDVLAGLASALEPSINALLKEARETQDETIFARPVAQAKQNAWLTLLRRVTSEALTMVALRLGQGSKSAKPVREFLPQLLATVTRKPLSERPGAVKQAASRLGNLAGQFDEKASLAARLVAAADGAQSAVDANASAFNAWDKERSEEVVAKGRLRLELERTHRLLGAQFPGQRDFVETFFLKGAKPSEGTSDDEPSPPGQDDDGADAEDPPKE